MVSTRNKIELECVRDCVLSSGAFPGHDVFGVSEAGQKEERRWDAEEEEGQAGARSKTRTPFFWARLTPDTKILSSFYVDTREIGKLG